MKRKFPVFMFSVIIVLAADASAFAKGEYRQDHPREFALRQAGGTDGLRRRETF